LIIAFAPAAEFSLQLSKSLAQPMTRIKQRELCGSINPQVRNWLIHANTPTPFAEWLRHRKSNHRKLGAQIEMSAAVSRHSLNAFKSTPNCAGTT
jgi:hypothetical protein